MDHELLGKKMSALRLAETRNIARPTSGLQYQPVSSHVPPYNYATTVSQLANFEPRYEQKFESIYANLEELKGPQQQTKVKARYPDPMVSYIPPPEQFSQNLVQIAHVPTQSKVSLEEAMRYTPPNLMAPVPQDAPVYENIQFYSAHKSTADQPTPRSAVANSTPYQVYQPVSSNVAQLETNAYFATQQPLQQMQFNPSSQASLKCKPYSPPYPGLGMDIQKPPPQRFSQPTPIYQHQSQQLTAASAYENKSPLNINSRQQMFTTTSPTQLSSAGSSPKIPLATIPIRKVIYYSL